jgi:hypothetical protein
MTTDVDTLDAMAEFVAARIDEASDAATTDAERSAVFGEQLRLESCMLALRHGLDPIVPHRQIGEIGERQLRWMAARHADHPDYRPEWQVTSQ